MTDPTKIKLLELCPDIGRNEKNNFQSFSDNYVITIADVLRAMHASENCRDGYYSVGIDGGIYRVRYTYPDKEHCIITHDGIGSWNLEKDYDGQTEETKTFIGSLLGV